MKTSAITQARSWAAVSAASLAVLVMSGCPSTGNDTFKVALAYRPATAPPDASAKLDVPTNARLHVLAVADARKDPSLIGKSSVGEDRNPVRAVGSLPAVYLHGALTHQLGRAGFNVSETQQGANLVLLTTVVTFFVRERENYEAEVSARFELRDAAGKVLFEQRITGAKTQWGRTLSEENYQEVIGKATADLVANLVSHPGFKRALADR